MIRSCRTYTPPSKDGEGERILFLRYSALGDILIVTPYCRALKERYPRSHVTWLAYAQYVPFLREQPYIDSVLPWDKAAGEREFLSLLRRVGRERFTRLVSFHSSDRGALIALFSKTPLRFCNARNGGGCRWSLHTLRWYRWHRPASQLRRPRFPCRGRLFVRSCLCTAHQVSTE